MQKYRMMDEQKGALFLLVIILIIISVSVIFFVSLQRDAVTEKLGNDQVLRTLFVMEDEDGTPLFSNVLIYYPVSKKGAIVNIPGNTGAIFQSLGRVDRIDDVYKEKGIGAYVKEIENLLGCNIPFYVQMYLPDFERLSDMLGGLRVFIPLPVDQASEDGERWLLPSGAVTLDGDKVSVYLRFHVDGETDSDIQERRQNVVAAFFTALHDKQSSVFLNKRVFGMYSSLMNINLDKSDAFKLLSLIAAMDVETIIKQNVTGYARIVDGQRLIFPRSNGEFIKDAVKQSTKMLISTSDSFTSRIYVLEIKNGTTTQGLAHNTSILYQDASYDVLSAVNADRNDYEKTVIIDHIGNKEIAKTVGEFIRCTNIVEEETADPATQQGDTAADVDFTIILGRDFDGRYVRE